MKSKRNLIIGIVAFALVIAGAVVLYQHLAGDDSPAPNLPQQQREHDARSFTTDDLEYLAAPRQPMVLNFWTTWCPACTRMLPSLEAAYREFGDEVRFMAINLVGSRGETPQRAMELIEREGYTFPVYFDADSLAAPAFRVSGIPVTVFIDAQGEIAHQAVGTLAQSALFEHIESIR